MQGLPADFDLHAAFGWNREQILAKASELAGPDLGDPSQTPDLPNPSGTALGRMAEEGDRDPAVAQGENVQGPILPS